MNPPRPAAFFSIWAAIGVAAGVGSPVVACWIATLGFFVSLYVVAKSPVPGEGE